MYIIEYVRPNGKGKFKRKFKTIDEMVRFELTPGTTVRRITDIKKMLNPHQQQLYKIKKLTLIKERVKECVEDIILNGLNEDDSPIIGLATENNTIIYSNNLYSVPSCIKISSTPIDEWRKRLITIDTDPYSSKWNTYNSDFENYYDAHIYSSAILSKVLAEDKSFIENPPKDIVSNCGINND